MTLPVRDTGLDRRYWTISGWIDKLYSKGNGSSVRNIYCRIRWGHRKNWVIPTVVSFWVQLH